MLDLVSLLKHFLLKTRVVTMINKTRITHPSFMPKLDQGIFCMSQIVAKIFRLNLSLLNFKPQFFILMFQSHILKLCMLKLLSHSFNICSIIGIGTTCPCLYAQLFMFLSKFLKILDTNLSLLILLGEVGSQFFQLATKSRIFLLKFNKLFALFKHYGLILTNHFVRMC